MCETKILLEIGNNGIVVVLISLILKFTLIPTNHHITNICSANIIAQGYKCCFSNLIKLLILMIMILEVLKMMNDVGVVFKELVLELKNIHVVNLVRKSFIQKMIGTLKTIISA